MSREAATKRLMLAFQQTICSASPGEILSHQMLLIYRMRDKESEAWMSSGRLRVVSGIKVHAYIRGDVIGCMSEAVDGPLELIISRVDERR